MIEADYQLFNEERPAGEVRLYISVDVETKAPPSAEELPSRIAPSVYDSAGRLSVAMPASASPRRASLAEQSLANVKSTFDCNVVVFAAPPHRRIKAPDVVKDPQVWTGAKREEHKKLAQNVVDHQLHPNDASLNIIDIRTTSKLPGKVRLSVSRWLFSTAAFTFVRLFVAARHV
jgi:hypothetical protein